MVSVKDNRVCRSSWSKRRLECKTGTVPSWVPKLSKKFGLYLKDNV